MAEKDIEKDTLKAQKEAEKAADKAKKERIKQSKPKKEGTVVSRSTAAVKKFCKDFAGTCKKVVWPTGKQVLKNSGVVLATILVIGIAVALVDLGLTSVFDLAEEALGELGDKYATTEEVTDEEDATEETTSAADEEITSAQEEDSSDVDESETEAEAEAESESESETQSEEAVEDTTEQAQ